jgi:hypothetical protein
MSQFRVFSLLLLSAVLGWFASDVVYQWLLPQEPQRTMQLPAAATDDPTLATSGTIRPQGG